MSDKINKLALVLLSGGQDSVTCLGYALARFERVQAISFNYGQRHAIELLCASHLCVKYKIPAKVVRLDDLLSSLVTSALTGPGEIGKPHAYKPGLPSSFVPGRNALFFTLAHAHAQEIKADAILTGVCQTDYSGYPDCRAAFVAAFGSALNLGYETKIQLLAPLMKLTKGMTFALAEECGFLEEVLENSHTCYEGNHSLRHPWGYGCNACPACELRRKGWDEYQTIVAMREDTGDDFSPRAPQ